MGQKTFPAIYLRFQGFHARNVVCALFEHAQEEYDMGVIYLPSQVYTCTGRYVRDSGAKNPWAKLSSMWGKEVADWEKQPDFMVYPMKLWGGGLWGSWGFTMLLCEISQNFIFIYV